MIRLLAIVIGYAIGCLQSAYIVGKIHKIDIREHGSGNAGSTNVLRTLGVKAGAIVFILDIFKAVISVLITSYICCKITGSHDFFKTYGLYGGIGTILGHNFPFYLNFKGGKGIACSIGVLCALDVSFGLTLVAIGILIIIISRYVSLASVSVAVIAPFMLLFLGLRQEIVVLVFCVSALAIYQHRSNIKRLISGTENKFSIKKKE